MAQRLQRGRGAAWRCRQSSQILERAQPRHTAHNVGSNVRGKHRLNILPAQAMITYGAHHSVLARAEIPHRTLQSAARQSRARAGGSASAKRSVLRTDCPAVLGLVARRTTRCAHWRSLRSDRVRQVRLRGALARAGHKTWPCRPRRASRPGRSPGTNGPLDRLCPGSPPRRPAGALPPARARLCGANGGVRCEAPIPVAFAAGGTRQGRFVGRRGEEDWGRRAQRASWTDSPHLSERSERSERSELCGATPGRAPQRSRQRSADRSTMSPCRVPPGAMR